VYAGVAYEVHALGSGAGSMVVDPSTYIFRTGDRFAVYIRPSLPGRMEVYNTNPLGQRTRIDTTTLAAGQLTTLGPYQFSATTGDESLELLLSPCSSTQLLAGTRDIINPAAGAAAPSTGAALTLASCTAPLTRGIRTRDIQKVGQDGSTSFALDPVSSTEVASGQLAPRSVRIVFHHQ
jgi:hypothetical protein